MSAVSGQKELKLTFDLGMLTIKGLDQSLVEQLSIDELTFDKRTLLWSAPAYAYRRIVSYLHRQNLAFVDHARRYKKIDLNLQQEIIPRDHQQAALDAWKKAAGQGVVSLPTGAGKTILAVLTMVAINRSTLVVVPTIDLLLQWQQVLQNFFGVKIGAYGGGFKELADVTVSTYDSAHMIIESVGSQFGFLVFDECHHLPAPQYQLIAKGSLAPYRLGLSATVERADGQEELIYQLVGDLVYEGHISEMVSDVLAPYDVISVPVKLSDSERQAYEKARACYVAFIRKHRINMSSPAGWGEFIRKTSYLPDGAEAMKAYREQKQLSQGAEAKIAQLWPIFTAHLGERIIIFTHDNQLAYKIGCAYFLPVLTHQTKAKERKRMLADFREGELDILVTSKVLNEGVDVPEASVGIVVSGSATVREHVQRLGRILRHKEGKRAVLYELVSQNTSEFYVNKRRRRHNAYQKSASVHKTV